MTFQHHEVDVRSERVTNNQPVRSPRRPAGKTSGAWFFPYAIGIRATSNIVIRSNRIPVAIK